jgi:hypothetical protein
MTLYALDTDALSLLERGHQLAEVGREEQHF